MPCKLTKRLALFPALLYFSLITPALGIRVATYNVENYNICDRRVEGVYRKQYPKPEESKAALREVILEVNPDILALQEIGGSGYIKELLRDLSAQGLEYEHQAWLEAQDTERMVAIVSKVPFEKVVEHKELYFDVQGETALSKRGLLEVRFFTKTQTWTLFVLHLKSRLTSDIDDFEAREFRKQEARSIRDYLRKNFNEEIDPYLITGDFNCGPATDPVQSLMRFNKKHISLRIPCKDEQGQEWTYFYRKNIAYEGIDLFLASSAMIPHIPTREGHIYNGSAWQQASDHRLVYLDLDFAD